MLNNFIGGGQVFLHKVRMFWQVFTKTIHIAVFLGLIASIVTYSTELKQLDYYAFYSYRKAFLSDDFDGVVNNIRASIGKKPNHITFVNAKTKMGIWGTKIDPRKVIRAYAFKSANDQAIDLFQTMLIWTLCITLSVFSVIVFVWSKFRQGLKEDRVEKGANKVLTAKEVRSKLQSLGEASDLKIGDMPLVKDMETRHFLVTGSTGSGKTNLIHNLLVQVEKKRHPALIIDQTGEMIAKYYNPKRGDIIFNPFDARGTVWDLWTDCNKARHLEKFADTLIGFNSRKNNKNANDFWEEAAQSVFVELVTYLQRCQQYAVQELCRFICQSDHDELRRVLNGTNAIQYFAKDNAKAAASIMSVLMANTKPLRFLSDKKDERSFSIQEYIQKIDKGFCGWLFLAAEPSTRELNISINAALLLSLL